jgi:DNA-binding NtrC family response regulator
MSLEHPRILLADDDAQIRRLYRKLLIKAGLETSEAATGKEVLKALHSDRFDLLILDLSMPETDGFELLTFIREHLPNQRTLVISGLMADTMLHMATHLGATATLDKVLAPQMLVETVRKMLGMQP